MPTVLDMIKLKTDEEIPGWSLLPYMNNKQESDLPTYLETYAPRETFGWSELLGWIQGDWQYIPATTGAGGMGSGANAADERFATANIPEPLLFDLATDPNETTNIITQHSKRARELAKRLETIKGASAKPAQAKR